VNVAKVLEETFSFTIDNSQIFVKADVCVEVDLDDLDRAVKEIIENEKVKDDLENLRSKNDVLNDRIESLKDSLYTVKSIEEKEQIHSKIIKEHDKKRANEYLAEAWIVLAQQSSSVLSEGSTTEENRRKAENLLLEALALDSENSEVYRTLGIIYMEDGNHQRAEEHFQKAIEAEPETARHYYSAGLSFYSRGEIQRAMTYFQRAIDMDSTLWFAMNMMGVCHYEMGEIKKAIDFYQKTLSINSNHLGAKYNLGICYYYRQEYELALSAFIDYKESAKGIKGNDQNYSAIADSLIHKIKTNIQYRE